ncbi:MAG: metal ABC transporter permease [Thermodesulfobacteriota bacterium]
MIELLQYEFMRNALLAGLLASVICGVMGTLVVTNRIVFLSGGIAHAAYGGIGMSVYFHWPYLAGASGFSVVAAWLMAAVSMKNKHRADTVIGVIWAMGMATGIIFLDLSPGYNVDLIAYLFGSIIAVPDFHLWIMLVMAGVIVGLVFFFYNDFLALSYDEEFAKIRGVPTGVLYILMIVMLAVTVVMVIQIVGLILVIALLTIPPYIVEKRVNSLARMMIGASLLGAVFTVTGLWISCVYNLTSGAAIIMVAGTVFFVTTGIDRVTGRYKRKKAPPEPEHCGLTPINHNK